MDKLDSILLEAWNRISARVRAKRLSAFKRSRRRLTGALTRPMRDWCLVLRAADTRINAATATIVDGESYSVHSTGDHIAEHRGHTVVLDGALIRQLTRPVMIPWPGVTYREAARLCGREYQTIKNWVHHGVFNIRCQREFRFPEFTRRSKHGGLKTGDFGGRPYLWTPWPLDVNNFQGRTPHRVWGSLWLWQWEKMPAEYELVVQRVPALRPRKGQIVFRGWDFICPGRVDVAGNFRGCGRRCWYLYAPQTVWTLGRAMQEPGDAAAEGFDMPEGSGLAGQWFPGLDDPTRSGGPRSFACKTCWRVTSACMANHNGWNAFITHISGGLLYGRDVPRPLDICPIERKKPKYRRKRRPNRRATVDATAAAAIRAGPAIGA